MAVEEELVVECRNLLSNVTLQCFRYLAVASRHCGRLHDAYRLPISHYSG